MSHRAECVWLAHTPVAMFTPDPVNPSGAPLVYFIHTDHLDAPRIVVDRNNQMRRRWLAEPFGTTAPESNPQGGLCALPRKVSKVPVSPRCESGAWWAVGRSCKELYEVTVMKERTALLSNALDALDRLFDCEVEIIDVGAILYATGLAIRPDELSPLFLDAASSLERIRHAGLPLEDARESSLRSTNSLRKC